MIPEDLRACPYILFTSRGVHTHPPPEPNKPSQVIMGEVLEMIQRRKNPDLALSMTLYYVSMITY